MKIGDRVCYNSTPGDTSFGTVTKVNRKTVNVDDLKQFAGPVRVDKELIFEIIENNG